MNTVFAELSTTVFMDPGFRRDDGKSRSAVVPAAPFLFLLAVDVAGALLGAVHVALAGLAVAEQDPEQDGREEERPHDVDDSPTASACVHE
jgi:hypothetical protein